MSEPVTDYYGRQLKPEPVMASIGPVVDLEIDGVSEFFRLTPEKAIELGRQLQQVGEEQS